jgi:rhodanese-related sulfurtransferase
MNIIFKIILLLLIVSMGILTYSSFKNEGGESDETELGIDDDYDIPSRVVKVKGQHAIRLGIALQEQSGIKTQKLEAMDVREEFDAFGRIFNINGLVELHTNLNKIRGQKNVVLSELTAANKKLKRLQILHREAANISTRQLQEVEAESITQQAKLKTLNSELTDVRTEAEQAWGSVLTAWVIDNDTDAFEQLLSGKNVIVTVSLRANDTLPDQTEYVYIGRNGNRSLAQKAVYISPAIESDSMLQGETYYFLADASLDKYRAGMHVHVWVPQTSESISGVFVPESAVVWSSGKPWVYTRDSEELFIKHVINNPVELDEGIFVAEGLEVGDKVVTSGAQMLLAEEYRWSIPDEDDNP